MLESDRGGLSDIGVKVYSSDGTSVYHGNANYYVEPAPKIAVSESKDVESDDEGVRSLQAIVRETNAANQKRTKGDTESFNELVSVFNNYVGNLNKHSKPVTGKTTAEQERQKKDQLEEINTLVELALATSEKAATKLYAEYQILKAHLVSLDAACKVLQKGEIKFSQILTDEIELVRYKVERLKEDIETFKEGIGTLAGFINDMDKKTTDKAERKKLSFVVDKELYSSLEDTLHALGTDKSDKDKKNGTLAKEVFKDKELVKVAGYAKKNSENAMASLDNNSASLLKKIRRIEQITRPEREKADKERAVQFHEGEGPVKIHAGSSSTSTPPSPKSADKVTIHTESPDSSPKAVSAIKPGTPKSSGREGGSQPS